MATLILSFLLLGAVASAQLSLHNVSAAGNDAIVLKYGMKICPSNYPEGLNIHCQAPESDTRAKFLVNGGWVRTEVSKPFFLASDVAGRPRPWTSYPRLAMISCVLSPSGVSYTASVEFACTPSDAVITNPPPSSTSPTLPDVEDTVTTLPPVETTSSILPGPEGMSDDSATTMPPPSTTSTIMANPDGSTEVFDTKMPSPFPTIPPLPDLDTIPKYPVVTTPPPSTMSTTLADTENLPDDPMAPIPPPSTETPEIPDSEQGSLLLVPAERRSKLSVRLTEGMEICPDSLLGQAGFSIECAGIRKHSWAEFYINGAFVRQDWKWPFYIVGDRKASPKPWRRVPSGWFSVSCKLDDDIIISVERVRISCEPIVTVPPVAVTDVIVTKPPQSTDMNIVPPGPTVIVPTTMATEATGPTLTTVTSDFTDSTGMTTAPAITTDMTVPITESTNNGSVPTTEDPTVSPTAAEPPNTIETTIVPMTTAMTDTSDGTRTTATATTPTAAMTTEMTTTKTTTSSTTSTTTTTAPTERTSTVTEAVPPENDDVKTRAGCIFVPAKGATLSAGWVSTSNGISFNPNSSSKKLTKAGVSPLSLPVTVTRTSRYAIVVDMTTSGGADFNDVWLRLMPGGFQIMREGVSKKVSGWIKGYHNKNGRAVLTSTVDFNGHSIASGDVLQAGQEYDIEISGRSNRVTVHQVLLFPCSGDGCQRRGWRDTQNICIPNSL